MALRGFGFTTDLKSGLTRHLYIDKKGIKRWVDNDETVSTKSHDLKPNEQNKL